MIAVVLAALLLACTWAFCFLHWLQNYVEHRRSDWLVVRGLLLHPRRNRWGHDIVALRDGVHGQRWIPWRWIIFRKEDTSEIPPA